MAGFRPHRAARSDRPAAHSDRADQPAAAAISRYAQRDRYPDQGRPLGATAIPTVSCKTISSNMTPKSNAVARMRPRQAERELLQRDLNSAANASRTICACSKISACATGADPASKPIADTRPPRHNGGGRKQ